MGTAFKKLTVSAIKRCTGAGLRVLTAGDGRCSAFEPYPARIIMLGFGMLVAAALSTQQMTLQFVKK
jgi:hypothetical protein